MWIAIKDLEWRVEDEGEGETWLADTIVGRYIAWMDDKGISRAVFPGDGLGHARAIKGHRVEAALAAANADFQERIQSVLVDAPGILDRAEKSVTFAEA